MFEYIMDCFEWTDGQCSMVNWNWTAIGRKKKQLRREQSMRTSKMMHEWTNVSKQKANKRQKWARMKHAHVVV
jgi:hypothetical protein